MDVRFGVFDHVDEAAIPAGRQLAERLQPAERLDAAGFHAYHAAETEPAGVNYLCVDLAFGDITLAEALRTVELLAAEVMPHFGR